MSLDHFWMMLDHFAIMLDMCLMILDKSGGFSGKVGMFDGCLKPGEWGCLTGSLDIMGRNYVPWKPQNMGLYHGVSTNGMPRKPVDSGGALYKSKAQP